MQNLGHFIRHLNKWAHVGTVSFSGIIYQKYGYLLWLLATRVWLYADVFAQGGDIKKQQHAVKTESTAVQHYLNKQSEEGHFQLPNERTSGDNLPFLKCLDLYSIMVYESLLIKKTTTTTEMDLFSSNCPNLFVSLVSSEHFDNSSGCNKKHFYRV